MSNTDFENLVLQELKGIKGEMGEMKSGISLLHSKFDRLDDRLDEVESNLKQEMKLQGAYLNQAFDRMNFLNQQANSNSSFQ
ncbi:hypothetical protein N9J72_00030 [Candidatus Gracilibacteria bacterium]|nr:hypothetical protein [Candidatus Gracilibacteria bacterium]